MCALPIFTCIVVRDAKLLKNSNSMVMEWTVAIVFILLVAFFSLIEISLSLAKRQHFLSGVKNRLPSFYSHQPEKVNITVFLGYHISFIGAIICFFKCLFPVGHETGYHLFLFMILFVLILFFGWFILSFALVFIALPNSNRVLRAFKIPMALFYYF